MPQLDKGFEIFANWQTIVFAMGIYLVTYVLRHFVESFWKNWKTNRIYTELWLHVSPIVIGALIAQFARKFPWPMPIADSVSARMMYGGILGMFCGVVYGRVRAWVSAGTGGAVNLPGMSPIPPASPDAPTPVIPPTPAVPAVTVAVAVPLPPTPPAMPAPVVSSSDPTPTPAPITKPETPALKASFKPPKP